MKLDSLADMPIERTLGLRWNLHDDTFVFTVCLHSDQDGTGSCTKRSLLSRVMSVFDQLGFLASFTVRAKILLQDVWRAGLGWDDELPAELQSRWDKWWREVRSVSTLKIPRCYSPKIPQSTVELHVFCDASSKAFAAVAYLRVLSQDEADTAFVSAKTRMAPLKPMSIPRLELQAAVMGSRLAQRIKSQQSLKLDSIRL